MSSAARPSVLAAMPHNTDRTVTREREAAGVPWFIWTGVAGITSAFIGAEWDVSWHRSIGRDSFWTPAHLMIQLCGVLAAVVGLWLVYQCTFNRQSALREASVNVFGLRAPLGVFLAGWGGVAMITSAPFDNWWHAAYGLDVKIVSPPHTLLILGIRAVGLGVFFLILATMNRAAAAGSKATSATLQRLLLYLGGLTVCRADVLSAGVHVGHRTAPGARLHRPGDRGADGACAHLAGLALSLGGDDVSAAIYTRWLLIAADPDLSALLMPSRNWGRSSIPVTHLVPAKFPVLIVLPALRARPAVAADEVVEDVAGGAGVRLCVRTR